VTSKSKETLWLCVLASTVSCITAMVDHDDAEAATLKVLASLPKQFHGLWYTISELAGHLQDSGISVISRATVAKMAGAC
jgi:hypothetical protein